LDATKANLFFAKGVILVEGDAENILIPTLADLLDRPLHKYGVSIVNVGSTAFLHYVNIFKRKDGSALPIKVSVVTDLDNKLDQSGHIDAIDGKTLRRQEDIENKYDSKDGYIKTFCSPLKTLEFDIAMGNLFEYMEKAIKIAERIRYNDGWITDEEVENIQPQEPEREDVNMRAKNIYTPLDKNYASKAVAAQWFSRLLNEDRNRAVNLIAKDYQENTGIKYLIQAIEHVTKKVDWQQDAYK
jgi:putative ATP-dependent endonuclease of OLD family